MAKRVSFFFFSLLDRKRSFVFQMRAAPLWQEMVEQGNFLRDETFFFFFYVTGVSHTYICLKKRRGKTRGGNVKEVYEQPLESRFIPVYRPTAGYFFFFLMCTKLTHNHLFFTIHVVKSKTCVFFSFFFFLI